MSANGKTYGPKDGGTYLDRAQQHWSPMPDWVKALAGAADKSKSLGDLAERIGCTGQALSAVLSRKYVGNYAKMEARVRTLEAKSKFGPKDGGTYLRRAQEHWQSLPEWVAVLAKAADEGPSQGALAKKLGCNASVISAVISNNYTGRYDTVEARVRGALMNESVHCPVMGPIPRHNCIANQKLPFSAANPQRAQLFRACRNCRHAIAKEQK